MLLALNSDQELFSETTAKLLDELVPVGELRRLRDDPVGFDPEYWRRGAELGWTSLLVGEEHGGGSIGEHGLVDLALVAYQFGRHAAPGPLAVTNVVIATLSETGAGSDELIGALVSGASTASWCFGEPVPNDRLGNIAFEVRREGDEVVLNGVKRPVESASGADVLLVTGRTGSGLTQVLVPAGTNGVSVSPMDSVDLTRRFSVVTFDEVRLPTTAVVGDIGSADEQVARQLERAVRHRERRVGRGHAGCLRHDRGMGVRPVLLRAATGLLPGAQAPVRRHEVVAGGQPCRQRRRHRRHRQRIPPTPGSC